MPRKRNALPQDENAERFVLGAMLQGFDDERIDAEHFAHEGRRAIYLAAVTVRADGGLVGPATYTDARAVNDAARENAGRVADLMQRAGTWQAVDGPEHELRECLGTATQGKLIDHYAGILVEQWKRRELLQVSERLQRAACDDSADLADALAGIDLSDLRDGGRRNGRLSPVVLRLADVTPEPIRWLWPGRIARGKLTMLVGDPGLGKSLVTLDLAARVSVASCWPDGATIDGPGGVVLLNAEDDPADTIRVRCDAAGADVRRIVMLSAVRQRDSESGATCERSFCLQTDLAALETAIREAPDCRLVVIDPVTAYLGRADSHKNADIRALLAPLGELARRYGVAVVAVTHLNKASGMAALYRAMGSLAFVAAARAVWLVARDADDPSGRRRLMLPAKNNIGKDCGGLAYCLKAADVGNGIPVVAWEPDPVTVTADEALTPTDGRSERPAPALDEATEWLRQQLAAQPMAVKELKAAAEADGLKWTTVQRAKPTLGVLAERDGFGPGGAWVWKLSVDKAGDDRT